MKRARYNEALLSTISTLAAGLTNNEAEVCHFFFIHLVNKALPSESFRRECIRVARLDYLGGDMRIWRVVCIITCSPSVGQPRLALTWRRGVSL